MRKLGWITPFPMKLPSHTVYWAVSTADSGKSRGGGVRIFVSIWLVYSYTGKHCCPDLEYRAVRCGLFHLLREFSDILITAVYIPQYANDKLAQEERHSSVNNKLNANPEGSVIVTGDLNHAELKAVLPKLHKNVCFPTIHPSIISCLFKIKSRWQQA